MNKSFRFFAKRTLIGTLGCSLLLSPFAAIGTAYADQPGNLTVTRTAGTLYDEALAVLMYEDGSQVTVYNTNSSDGDFALPGRGGGGDMVIVKYGPDGLPVWTQVYGSTGTDYAASVKKTSDGGIVIAGRTDSSDWVKWGKEDVFLLKLDGDGNQEWRKSYGSTGRDYAYQVLETSDGHFLLSGSTSPANAGQVAPAPQPRDGDFTGITKEGDCGFILKVSAEDGTLTAKNMIGNKGYSSVQTVVETSEGYLVSGQSSGQEGDFSGFQSAGYGIYDIYVANLNREDLSIGSIKQFGGSQAEQPYFSVRSAYPDSPGVVIAGRTTSSDTDMDNGTPIGAGGSNPFIAKFSEDGTKEWVLRIPPTVDSHDAEAGGLFQSRDGTYILAVNEAFENWNKGLIVLYKINALDPANITYTKIGEVGGDAYYYSDGFALQDDQLIGFGVDSTYDSDYDAIRYRFTELPEIPYQLQPAAKPTADPTSGAVMPGSKVALSTSTPDAEIYYTTDGTDPLKGLFYTDPIEVTDGMNLRAIATKKGMAVSSEMNETYTVFAPPAAPLVTADDEANKMNGELESTEYSVDNGTNWTAYDPENEPLFEGTVTVLVRIKAGTKGNPLPGEKATLNFTPNATNPMPNDPTPTNPTPNDPTPTNPTPNDPTPTNPTPNNPTPTNPVLNDPPSTNPMPTNPTPSTLKPSVPAVKQLTVRVETGSVDNGAVVGTTPITRTTDPSGRVSDQVELTPERAESALSAVKSAGQQTARVMIPDEQDEVSQTEVSVPQAAVSSIGASDVNLEIFTENARIFVPQTSLDGFANDLYFRLIPVKTEQQRSELVKRVKSEPLIQSLAGSKSAEVVARPMTIETNMQSRPVDLTLPLRDTVLPANEQARDAYLSDLLVYIEHGDGEKALVQPKVVEYKAGQIGLQFGVSKFSTFSILHMEGWRDSGHAAYMKGFPDGSFRPDASVTRAQMAAILARNLGFGQQSGKLASSALPSDVRSSHWAAEDIRFVRSQGLMIGDPDGGFRPDAPISRSEMAMLTAALQKANGEGSVDAASPNRFADVSAGHWAADAIGAAAASGVFTGYADGTFKPKDLLTRAEAVTAINRMLDRTDGVSSVQPVWADVPTSHWASEAIEEASQDHYYVRLEDGTQVRID
ncbi:hypothetical protein CDO73_13400 [Saccharibacillus sp. O23]|uniref:DUF4073 domain-containing protein n=1 Tax=Saccharibacillus sp. O23 TaxID=2009338 RepID=UPI000B4E0879|nr:DUF4073 domain-containing protein [Saccharibacillus sp. O23]OWR30062.1 hypothetical protein CDO73_13400 [Saccharibacillus sp. O23]